MVIAAPAFKMPTKNPSQLRVFVSLMSTPSTEPTNPTLGKVKSSAKLPLGWDFLLVPLGGQFVVV